ncbi:MAG: hypothetical protein KAI47_00605, partial [Deltaproteobacteria bacterium]|nr:hypothetical protein [Deltaproteobacteria bacterium]
MLPLVRQNLRRNWQHNLLSSVGVVVGIALLTFFLALDAGVRRVVFGKIFPIDRIEVIPSKATLFGGAKRIDDALVRRLEDPPSAMPRPRAVYPKMKLAVPSRGWGGKKILGQDFYFEVSGFCEGIDARMLMGEATPPYRFVDAPVTAPPKHRCQEGLLSCPKGTYCVDDLGECHAPVPALISRHMIEIYNSSIAPTHPRMPKIPDFAASVFAGRPFTVELGRSYFGTRAPSGGGPVRRRFQLVGVSNKAAPLGLTIPLGYVKRWNARYVGIERSRYYTSVAI